MPFNPSLRQIIMYQQSLIDIMVFLLFVVGTKVLLLFMTKKKTPSVPRSRTLLWYGFGLWWLASAVFQMWPTMGVLARPILARDTWLAALAHVWSHHPMAYTLWSVVIQMVVGLILVTERENLAGRIALGLSMILSIGVWIWGEHWGGLGTRMPSLISGAPGAGFFSLVVSALLLLPADFWRRPIFQKRLRQGLASLWSLVAIYHLGLVENFWTAPPWRAVEASWLSTTQPGVVFSFLKQTGHVVSNYAAIMNIFFTLGALFLAWSLWRGRESSLEWTVAMAFLIFQWGFGQGFGFVPAYALNANSAPLLMLIMAASFLGGADGSRYGEGSPSVI